MAEKYIAQDKQPGNCINIGVVRPGTVPWLTSKYLTLSD